MDTRACSCVRKGGSPPPPTDDTARARLRGVLEFEFDGRRGLEGVEEVDGGGFDIVRLGGGWEIGAEFKGRKGKEVSLELVLFLFLTTQPRKPLPFNFTRLAGMPKDPEPSHVQREFTIAAIKAGIRTDGRKLTEARSWSLEWVGGEEGGLECRLGDTWYAQISSCRLLEAS